MEELLKQSYLNMTMEIDTLVNTTTGDIDLKCDYPYIIFKREDLLTVMQLTSKIIQNKSSYILYNSITLIPNPEEHTLTFFATNELSHFKYKAELIGDMSETFTQKIAIALNVLQRTAKLMGNKVLLYIKENHLYIRLITGDLLLDLKLMDKYDLKFPSAPTTKLAELDSTNIANTIASVLPLISTDVRGDSRKIKFDGTKALYQSYYFYFQANIITPSMVLNYRDAEFIAKLSKFGKLNIFNTNSTLQRLHIITDKVEYQFITPKSTESTFVPEEIQSIMNGSETTIELENLYKTIALISNLPLQSDIIDIYYSQNELILEAPSNNGTSTFRFKLLNPNISNNNTRIQVKIELLKLLLSAFNENKEIGLTLCKYGINISVGNINAFLLHSSEK